ncbi:MAG TPA: MATE family efflux transporter [Rhizomicrobium sp.]|nr:MATE family efflux transporter [Rhizomicrobium sp.]
MRDLTQGAIWRHLIGMATFIGAGLIVNTLYMLIDLYFVSRLGKQAVAGVASAGSAMYITMSIAQLVGVGSLSLISHAVGRKDQADAQLVFEQALSLGLLIGFVFLVVGYSIGGWAVSQIASDEQTARDARTYLFWYLPALASMFPNGALGSALRASGVVGIPTMIQSATVAINAVLAPILVMGFLTGHPLGVAGAGLASSIAAVFGMGAFAVTFNRAQKYMHLHSALHPKAQVWKRIIAIGLPATGEFALIFITTAVAYWSIRGFGPQAQAGYGIGARTMQAVFLPAMAVAFATGPIAGQNFGARHAQRVRDTFRHAAVMGGGIMLALTLLCQISPHVLVQPFSSDPAVVEVATGFLRIASWNFVAVGLTFCCSGMFQALGDTRPALISSGSRLLTYVVPAIWLAGQSWASLHDFWYLSLASIMVQALIACLLLRHQLHHKLKLFGAPV